MQHRIELYIRYSRRGCYKAPSPLKKTVEPTLDYSLENRLHYFTFPDGWANQELENLVPLYLKQRDQATKCGKLPQPLSDGTWQGGRINVGTILKTSATNHPLFVSELENTLQKGQGSSFTQPSKINTFPLPTDVRKHRRKSFLDQQYHTRKKKRIDEPGGFSPALSDNIHNYREMTLAWPSQAPTLELHKNPNEKTIISPTFRNDPAELELSLSGGFASPKYHLRPKHFDLHGNVNIPLEQRIPSKKPKKHPPQVLSIIFSPQAYQFFTTMETDLFYAFVSLLSKEVRNHHVSGRFSCPIDHSIVFKSQASKEHYSLLRERSRGIQVLGNNILRVHFTVLRMMSPKIENKTAMKEQEAIEDIYNQFFSSPEMILALQNFDNRSQSQLDEFQKLVLKYLAFPETNKLWSIPNSSSDEPYLVSRKRRLEIEITLSFIKSYYQSTNWEKWEALFKDDQFFLRFMINLAQLQKNNNQYRKVSAIVEELRSCATLIPWSDPLTIDQSESLKELKLLWPTRFMQKTWLESSVTPLLKKKPFEIPVSPKHEFGKQKFQLEQLGPKIYDFFREVCSKSLNTAPNSLIEMNVNESIDILLLKHLTQTKLFGVVIQPIPVEKAKLFVENKWKSFLQTLWFMNKQFLEIFGCKSSHPAYDDAQQELQKWVWENKVIQDIRRNLAPGHALQSEIQNITPFFNERISNDQTIAIRRPQTSNNFLLTGTEPKVKDVLDLLVHYYKTTNPTKFKVFYDKDEDFLKSLLVHTKYWGLEASGLMGLFQSFIPPEFMVLPWKDTKNAFEDIQKIEKSTEIRLFKGCYSYQGGFN
ncbi:hypothetical protein O181_033103 [Austropuccinia psidii MF-1]|uniref:Uncharacterized protein n=1 Tax=Austropuccinia psidii MF-1 TaxID=1389203 RepID=A0A9Q3H648_9BASI|nr:hypothetical protein [Austropuccinia psidii MF-1]